jgi:hypothetical protein
MPNPSQRDERAKLDKAEKKPPAPPPPAPPKTDLSLKGLQKTLSDRQKLLDET